MEAILSEIELGLSGLADPATAVKAGELVITSYSIHYTKLYE